MGDDSNIIAGLEIGTHKICVVVGEQNAEGTLNIIGLGQARSRGVRKGEIIDPQQAEEDLRAALRLITAFDQSPMAGLVDLRRVDVSGPGVIVATTGQGSQITFGLDNLEQQLRRWRQIHDYAQSQNAIIASADLAVENNVPVHLMAAGATPEATPKVVKPATNRRRNV